VIPYKTYVSNKHKCLVRAAQQAYVVALRGGRCEDCGNRHHPAVFDFHSIEGHHSRNVGSLYGGKLSKVLDEVSTCLLLCPTCHRIRHVEERHDTY